MQSVLLLNASYEPIKIISWQRAISMFFLGKVEVVEEYEHDIRSVSLVFKAPAVVKLVRYVHNRRKTPPLTRANILARDNFECQYCSTSLNSKNATLDHVIPRSQAGTTSWENIVLACAPCNRKKGGKTPEQAGMPLRNFPTKPGWLPVIEIKLKGEVPESWHDFISGWK
ncbi:MAG: HNH endonuclease [Bdellovibrionales bacterium]|nr:HNH endonuclease [Bdellovibrionales bacterium]